METKQVTKKLKLNIFDINFIGFSEEKQYWTDCISFTILNLCKIFQCNLIYIIKLIKIK